MAYHVESDAGLHAGIGEGRGGRGRTFGRRGGGELPVP